LNDVPDQPMWGQSSSNTNLHAASQQDRLQWGDTPIMGSISSAGEHNASA